MISYENLVYLYSCGHVQVFSQGGSTASGMPVGWVVAQGQLNCGETLQSDSGSFSQNRHEAANLLQSEFVV